MNNLFDWIRHVFSSSIFISLSAEESPTAAAERFSDQPASFSRRSFFRCVDRKVFLATWKNLLSSDVSFSSGSNDCQRGKKQFSLW